MAHPLINHALYDSIERFDESDEAKDYYYRIMDTETEIHGRKDTVRNMILRAYAMLFCEDCGLKPGDKAGPDEVEETADRLYTGSMGFDPNHWYRMRHHFPIIDDDNYDRFAALVISDLSAGPLRDAAVNGGDMLLVGDKDPLHMTRRERQNQHLRKISEDLIV